MKPPGLDDFLTSLLRHHNTGDLSDAVITCEDQVFKIHRVVLSAHSKYFARALNGEWKETTDRKIEIKDFDPIVVEAMLHFIYSFDYVDACDSSSMVFNAQVYQIADKYDIPALKTYSKNKFASAITFGWNTDDFPGAVSLICDTTPLEDRGLRDLVVDITWKNIDKLIGRDGFCELLRKTADFTADLILFLHGRTSKKKSRTAIH
ncbi:n-carbamoyl-l-amino acid hydrolase [Fusarium sporotrichioides]|uniref:N-carbamoyl-l-amino acid hydrolase n=1 Tax=Fusarium sporotrichioides TaxID=5514 RepID=A0A395SB04_FUSSP|nr:n-carbamoyl-l-amino acid hydrolase [Fusarium sporotrichioides]